jgi:CheY-like chemotaxis protein
VASRTALIIDDEPDVAAYLASVLIEDGWHVRTAKSGDRGLEMARGDAPDVVLLDLMMPGGRGGLSTFFSLRTDEELQSIPVVFVTACREPTPDDPESFLGRHSDFRPDGYIEKPVDPEDLLAMVDQVVREKREPGRASV